MKLLDRTLVGQFKALKLSGCCFELNVRQNINIEWPLAGHNIRKTLRAQSDEKLDELWI